MTVCVTGLETMPVTLVPSDHVTFQGAKPVSVAWIVADPPGQIEVLPLTLAVGLALTVTTKLHVLLHPLASVIVKLNVKMPAAAPALTVMFWLVAPAVIVAFVPTDQL